jgi:hypothetical protein
MIIFKAISLIAESAAKVGILFDIRKEGAKMTYLIPISF